MSGVVESRPGHFVDTRPFDPGATEPHGTQDESFYRASSWRLMWWKFRRHRVAVAAAFVLIAFYGLVPFVEPIAPYEQTKRNGDFLYAPPQPVHLIHEGRFVGPSSTPTGSSSISRRSGATTRSTARSRNRSAFCVAATATTSGDCGRPTGTSYVRPREARCSSWGPTAWAGSVLAHHLRHAHLAHDRTRRHRRLVHARSLLRRARRLSRRLGGQCRPAHDRDPALDPELPLWLALSAALPPNWSPILVFFGITIILGMLDWPGLARAVRSKLLSLREEDFVRAAELMGASRARIIARHLIPNFMSHLIASATLSIPSMILGETALSFLGLGLRPPVTSWGVLLNEAQNLAAVQLHPWLLFPILPVVLVVLAFSFMGDGLRDAADPYH
jgi:peptide/nickel transport system permease protein